MKRKISMFILLCSLGLAACNNEVANENKPTNQGNLVEKETKNDSNDENEQKRSEETMDLRITVGEKTFLATLYDNETTRALVEKFPLSLQMTELNRNEKYYQFSEQFPTTSEKIGEIQNGDIMLYQDDYLVLFYKTFSNPSYTYTRLGYIEDPAGLEQAVGKGNVTIGFEVTKK